MSVLGGLMPGFGDAFKGLLEAAGGTTGGPKSSGRGAPYVSGAPESPGAPDPVTPLGEEAYEETGGGILGTLLGNPLLLVAIAVGVYFLVKYLSKK